VIRAPAHIVGAVAARAMSIVPMVSTSMTIAAPDPQAAGNFRARDVADNASSDETGRACDDRPADGSYGRVCDSISRAGGNGREDNYSGDEGNLGKGFHGSLPRNVGRLTKLTTAVGSKLGQPHRYLRTLAQ